MLTSVAILTIAWHAYGQDNDYSQFWSSPSHLSPALTGMSYGSNLSINYRDRWPSFRKAFTSYSIAYDQYVTPLNGGLGVLIDSDNSGNGVYKTFSASGLYAYNIQSYKTSMRFGLSVGFIQKSINTGNLVYFDQIDPVYGINPPGGPISTGEPSLNANTVVKPDFGAGALLYNENYYLGFSVKHLTSPNISFSDFGNAKLPAHFSLHGGYVFKLKSLKLKYQSYFSPNFLYTRQAAFSQLLLGAHANYGPFEAGLYARHTFSNFDALITLVGIKYKLVRFGFSYDFTLSGGSQYSANSKEISIVLDFKESKKSNRKRQTRRSGSCPAIF